MALTPIHINHDLRYHAPDTYDVFFYGDIVITTVTADPSAVSRWISDVRSVRGSGPPDLLAGLDVEWRPSPTRYRQSPVATLQICVGQRCLVYQIARSGGHVPQSLEEFLAGGDYAFVGVGVQQDLDRLDADYGIGGRARAVDLRKLAAEELGQEELEAASLRELSSLVLGKEIDKPRHVTMSNWECRWLSHAQVQYACVDAYVSSEIGRALNADGKSK
ncbi:polynucleotidyl transferase [Striga asiatica]|uniref:Polynucleotidyl transferase n=1 Tax=Striga asiatica TaxID=4170 RepID=A0A5A7R3B1_STRAF|nr:polynucleotidyl transferase [Striga asiatica]